MTLNQSITQFIKNELSTSPHKLLDLVYVAGLFRVPQSRVTAAIALDPELASRFKIDRNKVLVDNSGNRDSDEESMRRGGAW
jgi:hypothetical protein